jgi:toxin ParE1/3/4
MRVVFSATARLDILSIGEYIASDSPLRAFTFMDEIETKALSLGETPYKGVARDKLREGLRLLIHGAYGIYYTVEADRIRISRVLHSALNLTFNDFTETD